MKNTIHTQFAVSMTADFEENTWTFLMPNKYAVCAGEFALVDKELYADLMKNIEDLLYDANVISEVKRRIKETVFKMNTIMPPSDGKI